MNRDLRSHFIIVGLFLMSGFSSYSAMAQKNEPDTAKAQLKIGSETLTLRSARALEMDDFEGVQAGGTSKKTIVLLFTDSVVPADAVGNFFRCARLARLGKMHGVELRIDAATKKMSAGTIYHSTGPENSPTVTISTSGDQGSYRLSNLQISSGQISGKAFMPEAEGLPHLDPRSARQTFQYEITFCAPLSRQPSVTADLKRAAALSSAPVQAVLAYEAACRRGDIQGARHLATPAATEDWYALRAKMGAEPFRKAMQESAPDAKTRLKQITRVVVRGDHATVLFNEQAGIGSQTLVMKNGKWLIDGP